MNLSNGFRKQLLLLLLIAGGALVVVFNLPAFMPDGNHAPAPFLNPSQMLFNNDNPLGWQNAEYNRLPGSIFGVWANLYWVGGEVIGDSPRITTAVATILHPTLFVKYYPCFSLLFLGFCAWLYFRQLKLSPAVCLFGGFAAAVNMHFFSCAVWGVFLWNIASGCMFLALAALATDSIRQWWARAILAGLAIGMAVMEGFDTGAILALGFEAALLATIWLGKGSWLEKIDRSISYSLLIAASAALLANYTIVSLIGTQIQTIAGTGANSNFNPQMLLFAFFAATVVFFIVRWIVMQGFVPRLSANVRKIGGVVVIGGFAVAVLVGGATYFIAKQRREVDPRQWSFSTQWSLPKLETLRLFIPGLMGYHMYENVDGPDKSSAYWGRIGEDLGLTAIREMRNNPDPEVRRQADEAMRNFSTGYRRHIGSGDYAGLIVMILAAFAAVNSFRRTGGPFSHNERRFVWFWTAAALLSLILAYGRHAFLYRFVFELPYFSTTRNPIKFLHPFFVCVLILNAYGAEAIWRNYLRAPVRAFGQFEKRWTYFWIAAVIISVFGLFVLVSKKDDLVHYLTLSGVVPGTETELASFCIGETVLYVLFLIATVGLLTLIIRGTWTGKQARWAWIAMGVLLLFDVGRADRWWLKYYNYKEKYALNPVLDFLRKEPYEKKSTAKLTPFGHYDISGCPAPRTPYDNNFYAVCNEWLQNQFPYYNIQALDIVQAPRTAEMDNKMTLNFTPRTGAELPLAARLWQLTSTRYIFCWTGYLNRPIYQNSPSIQGLDPSGNAFQVRARLNVIPAPGVKVPTTSADLSMEIADTGAFALVEYTNALPRAKLYSNWQTEESDDQTLATLKSPSFDPQKTVLLSKDTPVAGKPSSVADAGTVKIEDYHPKYIKMQANANAGAVLLLNEHWNPNWQVWVDSKQMPLLQCNYLMKGVYLDKGQHVVEFKFRPPLGSLYVTLAAWGCALLLAGFVIATNRGNGAAPAEKPSVAPQEKSANERA